MLALKKLISSVTSLILTGNITVANVIFDNLQPFPFEYMKKAATYKIFWAEYIIFSTVAYKFC